MICPTCHGNGYIWGEPYRCDYHADSLGWDTCSEGQEDRCSESDDGRGQQGRKVTQCAACSSSGEIGERERDD